MPSLWRLVKLSSGEPVLKPARDRAPGDLVLCRWRRAEMWRLIRLAERRADAATATDRHMAHCIVAAIDRAPDVLTDRPLDADGLLAWLFWFRGAAERLERVARLGP